VAIAKAHWLSAAIFVPLAPVVVIVAALLIHNTPAAGRPEDGARRRAA
jgi:hypothetical protein